MKFIPFILVAILSLSSDRFAAADTGMKLDVHIFLSSSCSCTSRILKSLEQVLATASSQAGLKIHLYDTGTSDLQRTKKFSSLLKPSSEMTNDGDKIIAKRWKAEVTPEAFVVDANNKILYRGAIAEEHSANRQPENYLAQAINAIQNGKSPETHPAWGCYINNGSLRGSAND